MALHFSQRNRKARQTSLILFDYKLSTKRKKEKGKQKQRQAEIAHRIMWIFTFVIPPTASSTSKRSNEKKVDFTGWDTNALPSTSRVAFSLTCTVIFRHLHLNLLIAERKANFRQPFSYNVRKTFAQITKKTDLLHVICSLKPLTAISWRVLWLCGVLTIFVNQSDIKVENISQSEGDICRRARLTIDQRDNTRCISWLSKYAKYFCSHDVKIESRKGKSGRELKCIRIIMMLIVP